MLKALRLLVTTAIVISNLSSWLYSQSYGAYVPQDGLQVWLKADSLDLVDGEPVGMWRDLSGNANHAIQPTGSRRPIFVSSVSQINGLPAIRLDSLSQQHLVIPHTAGLMPSEQVTVIAIASRAIGAGISTSAMMIAEKGVTGGGSNAGYGLRFATAASAAFYINSDLSTGPIVSNNFHMLLGVYDKVNTKLYVNGSLSAPISAYSSTIGSQNIPLGIGARITGSTLTPSYTLHGDIAELLIYSRALSDVERREIEAYLHAKYTIGSAPIANSPRFSVPTGTYGKAQRVDISCPDLPGATIRYTTNGSDPDETSPVASSLLITQTTTVKARAFRAGYTQPTLPATAVITIDPTTFDLPRDGMRVWLRADSLILADGAAVDTWPDQSGKLNHAIAGQVKPVYEIDGPNAKPTVKFSAGQYLSVSNSETMDLSQVTTVIVMKRTSGASEAIVVEKISSSGYSLQMPNLASIRQYIGANSATAATPGGYFIGQAIFDEASIRLHVNGAPAVSAPRTSPTPANTQPIHIGGRAGALTLVGEIAELMIYDRGLSEAERQDIDAYLHFKYKITGQAQPKIGKPQFNISEGSSVYSQSQEVQITGPAGAQLFYKKGTDDWKPYTKAISVASSSVITAKATKPYYLESEHAILNLQIETSTEYVSRNGLELWLKADSLNLTDNAVAEWMDVSGKGNHARQSNIAQRPTFLANGVALGKPSVKFEASNLGHLIVTNTPGLNPQTVSIFAVAKRGIVASTWATLVNKNSSSSGYSLRFGSTSNTATAAVNSFNVGTPIVAPAVYHTLCSVYDRKKLKVYIDSQPPIEAFYEPAIAPNTANLTIGGRGAADILNGELAELLVFSRPLAPDEVRKLESYAFKKYGVGEKPRAEPPTSSMPDGFIFNGEKNLAFSATEGAVIFYTAASSTTVPPISDSLYEPEPNGFPATTNPPSGWIKYTSPIPTSASTTYRAITLLAGHKPSAEAIFKIVHDDTTKEVTKLSPVFWLRADTPHTNNNKVSLWRDSSGNGFDVGNTLEAEMPAYITSQAALSGRPTISFNGSTTVLLNLHKSNLKLGDATFVVVAKASGSSRQVVVHDVNLARLNESGGTGNHFHYVSATQFQQGIEYRDPVFPDYYRHYHAASLTAGEFAILVGDAKASRQANAYKNYERSIATPADTYVSSPVHGPFSIGATPSNGSNLNGEIAEIIIYPKVLTDAERRKVEAYLNNRYGITAVAAPALPPQVSPVTGTYSEPQTVKITSGVEADIFYKRDGNDPFDDVAGIFHSNAEITSPFEVNTTERIVARSARLLGGTSGQTQVPFAVSEKTIANITIEPATASISRKGLKLWLKADSLMLDDNDNVTRWEDQSGQQNHAEQTNATYQPSFVASSGSLNNKPSINFGNGNVRKYLTIPYSSTLASEQISMVAIVRRSGGTSSAYLIRRGTTYNMLMDGMGTVRSRINSSDETGVLTNSQQGKFNVLISTYDQSWHRLYVNGVQADTPLALTTAINNVEAAIHIGSDASGYFFTGEIAEILIYDHALGDEARQGILNYANVKYGIATESSLPTPKFDLADGTYATPQYLEITSDHNYPIYYTLDGSEPTTAAELYSQPLLLSSTQTVKAIAAMSPSLKSSVSVLRFVFQAIPGLPTDNGAPSSYQTDSDGDGVPDAVETAIGSAPNNASSTGGGLPRSYQYDALHQLINDGSSTYNYDAEGNVSRN